MGLYCTVAVDESTGVIDRSVDICPHFFLYNNEGNRGHGLSFIQVWRCTTISNLMINEQIRDKEVRLIGSDGEQLGIMSAKEAKKKQKTIDVKEVRLSPNIDTNDLMTKVNAARKFLTKGDRVKVTLRFRGREMAHMASSKHVLDDFAEHLSDIATIEKAPKVEGRSMTMFLSEKR